MAKSEKRIEPKFKPTSEIESEKNYLPTALKHLQDIDAFLLNEQAKESKIEQPKITELSKNNIKNSIKDFLLDIIISKSDDINATDDIKENIIIKKEQYDIAPTLKEIKKDVEKLSLESSTAVRALSTYLSNNKSSIEHETNAIVDTIINNARNKTIEVIDKLLKAGQITMKLSDETIGFLKDLKDELKQCKTIGDVNQYIVNGMEDLKFKFDDIKDGDKDALYNVFRSFLGNLSSLFLYFDLQHESSYDKNNVFAKIINTAEAEAEGIDNSMSILSNTGTIHIAMEQMIMNKLTMKASDESITKDNAVTIFHTKIDEIIKQTTDTPENQMYLTMLEAKKSSSKSKKVEEVKKVEVYKNYDTLIKTLMLAANPITENVSKMDKLLFQFHTKSEKLLSQNNDKILTSQYENAISRLSNNYESTLQEMHNDYSAKIANGQDGESKLKVYDKCKNAMLTITDVYKGKITELQNKKLGVLKNILHSMSLLIQELESCPIHKDDESKVISQLRVSSGIIKKITDAGFNIQYTFTPQKGEGKEDNVILNISLTKAKTTLQFSNNPDINNIIHDIATKQKCPLRGYEDFLPKKPSFDVILSFKEIPQNDQKHMYAMKIIQKYFINYNRDNQSTITIDSDKLEDIRKSLLSKNKIQLSDYTATQFLDTGKPYNKDAQLENSKKQTEDRLNQLREIALRSGGKATITL